MSFRRSALAHCLASSAGGGAPIAVAAWLLALPPPILPQPAAGYQVIVHRDNPTSALVVGEVSELFLGRRKEWPDGNAVAAVDLVAESPVRAAFSSQIHSREPSSVQNFWQRQLFTGAAVPPPQMLSDVEVMAFVRTRRGAVGYVSATAALDGVRLLPVVGSPERVLHVPPEYPYTARRSKFEGTVVLRVTLDQRGLVSSVVVVRELPHGLTEEATRAVRQWRYRPTTFGGSPIAVSFEVAVQFTLTP